MPISAHIRRDTTVMLIDDVFTHRNRKDFSSAVTTFRASGVRHHTVDLHEATYMDSSALGLRALTSQQFRTRNGESALWARRAP